MYLDSAVLVKLVVREPDSLFYADQVHGRSDVWVSEIALTECWSALLRKEREQAVDVPTRENAWRRLETYFSGEVPHMLSVTREILHRANRILDRCHPEVGLRSLDAIHLASCEAADAWPLLTSDLRMRQGAEILRLPLGPLPQR